MAGASRGPGRVAGGGAHERRRRGPGKGARAGPRTPRVRTHVPAPRATARGWDGGGPPLRAEPRPPRPFPRTTSAARHSTHSRDLVQTSAINLTGGGFPWRKTGWEEKGAREREPRSLTRGSRTPRAENRTPVQSEERGGRRARRGAGPTGQARLRAHLPSRLPPPLLETRVPRFGFAPKLYKVGTRENSLISLPVLS